MEQSVYEYDVALSFAGSDREVARVIAATAKANDLKVFIDEHYNWESWGKNLNEYLGDIYDRKSRFCVILISKDYVDRPYTNLERRRALDRALESKVEYILPVRIDDSWLDGLPRATAYLDLREMSATDVALVLVQKIKRSKDAVNLPKNLQVTKILPVARARSNLTPPPIAEPTQQPIEFVQIDIAEECRAWELREPQSGPELQFRSGGSWYDDPIFDVTIMNRVDKPVLLTAVGVEFVKLSHRGMDIMGGGGADVLDLHRTYKLPLPDLLKVLAEKQRAIGKGWKHAVDVKELAYCRLPDPILIENYRAYRFGLHLFDYVSFCPTDVELFFWGRTDIGQVRSRRVSLTFVIGSQIPPLSRYQRMLNGEIEIEEQRHRHLAYLRPDEEEQALRSLAYEFWERAGRPSGSDKEFWSLAEGELPDRLLTDFDLRMIHKRPL